MEPLTSIDPGSILAVLERLAAAAERQAESIAESLRPKPLNEIDKETQAIALAFTMPNPTKAAIAREIGYSNASALRHFRKFNALWDKLKMVNTITGGNGRSIVGYDGTSDDGDNGNY